MKTFWRIKELYIHSLKLIALSMGLIGSLNAGPLTGQFNLNGSVNVTATTIDWLPLGGPTGQFRTIDPSSGSFIGISDPLGTYTGLMKDLTNPPSGVNVPILVSSFLSAFTSPVLAPNGLTYNTLIFDLTLIRASTAPTCTGAEAVNVSCSAGAFPNAFTLKNTGSGTEVDFAIEGFFQFTGDVSTRTFGSGLYTTQLNGQSIGDVLTQSGQPGGFTAAYSANFVASGVPEPTTQLMLLAGIAMIGIKSYRRRE